MEIWRRLYTQELLLRFEIYEDSSFRAWKKLDIKLEMYAADELDSASLTSLINAKLILMIYVERAHTLI